MSLFASYVEKAALAVTQAEARMQSFKEDLRLHESQRPDGLDFDALSDWHNKTPALKTRIERAGEVLTSARAAAEKQARAAAVLEVDRSHAAAGKLATEQAKLTVEITADAERLAKKLKRLEDLRSSIEAANEIRGDRPAIIDGEFKVRQIPGELHPGRFCDDIVWVDKGGNVVKEHVYDTAYGKWIDNPAAVKQAVVRTQLVQEVHLSPSMPTRLADAIKLVDLQGKSLWPAQ